MRKSLLLQKRGVKKLLSVVSLVEEEEVGGWTDDASRD